MAEIQSTQGPRRGLALIIEQTAVGARRFFHRRRPAVAEHAVYDDASGQLIAGTMMDYVLQAARDLPTLEINLEYGLSTDANPLGVKGSGQAGAIAAPQTIMNAILDALAPLGIDHIEMPATSETIWRAIRALR